MRLHFEIKKIVKSPLYWLFLVFMLGLAYLPIWQRQTYQEAYIETYKEQVGELFSVLADLKLEEGSEEAQRMVGLKSDLESVGRALDEGQFGLIPSYRRLMYQDLLDFTSRYGQVFQERQSLTAGEVERLMVWNDWLLTHQLADGPENQGWSTGRTLQSYLEGLFGFLPLFLVFGLLLAGQLAERTVAYQRWQLLQWDSLGLQGVRRVAASLLSLLLAVGGGGLFILAYDGVTGQLAWSSLMEPVEILGQTYLLAIWLYLLYLLGFWLLLVLAMRLFLAFLDHLCSNRLLFLWMGLSLSLLLAYQTGGEDDWIGQVLPLLDFPGFLDRETILSVLLGVDLLLLFVVGLFMAYAVVTEKKFLRLSVSHQEELETGSLDRSWSLDGLLLRRSQSWKVLLLGNLLLALLFSLFMGLEKQRVAQEEGAAIEMVAQSYENGGWRVEAMQAEVNALRRLAEEDSSYQEDLDLKVRVLQEYRVYKDLAVKQWQAYQVGQEAMPVSHLALLKADQVYLWGEEERLFAEGGVGASQTVDNLRRYQTRNQLSQYYWEEVIEAGVPATKRGRELILAHLEDRFDTNQALVPTDEAAWDRSRDLSAIGSLRSLFDGPFYVVLFLLAVWVGSRGKAVEMAGEHWRLYQTQPVDLRKVLMSKWLLGLGQAFGVTVFFLTCLFLLNSLIGGWGYWRDGILLCSPSQGHLFLELVQGQELWVTFLPNAVYLPWMVVGLLMLEVLVISSSHLLQLRLSNRLLVYVVLIALLVFLDYLLFGELVLDGQEVFRRLVWLWR